MEALYLIFSGAFIVAVFYLWLAISTRSNNKRIERGMGESYEQEYEKPSGFEIFVAIFFPLLIIGPFVYLFLICFADSEESIFLFLAIIGFILYLAIVLICTSPKKKEEHT